MAWIIKSLPNQRLSCQYHLDLYQSPRFMPAIASLWHLLNFCAPAAFLAVLLVLARWVFARKVVPLLPWYGQLALHFLAGCAALFVALLWQGRDGSVVGYALLVLALATSQWAVLGGWRR
ncbi:phosphoglycerol transferase MdoB-like AlkP superfamily enzyme [Comamonas odontotermitis]|uniref:Phosphoglycerol transferase MdoB-like AlkP superfamily enzyme n=1 Tax=Comamonas odontotermitis TaxID=379895 RepID=A0ABR6REK4_9BURK|nr:hypothetical protein [Comamonas odontotermitis]MBB6577574.1 phosphoglycerol transferase MdoB-like AlkP superfamily enzyme [Comamonas odontotermitis]